eukprot:365896-Chlamydomonas_euryale.AAC.11
MLERAARGVELGRGSARRSGTPRLPRATAEAGLPNSSNSAPAWRLPWRACAAEALDWARLYSCEAGQHVSSSRLPSPAGPPSLLPAQAARQLAAALGPRQRSPGRCRALATLEAHASKAAMIFVPFAAASPPLLLSAARAPAPPAVGKKRQPHARPAAAARAPRAPHEARVWSAVRGAGQAGQPRPGGHSAAATQALGPSPCAAASKPAPRPTPPQYTRAPLLHSTRPRFARLVRRTAAASARRRR